MEAQEDATHKDVGNLVENSLPKTGMGYDFLSPPCHFTKLTDGFMHVIYIAANLREVKRKEGTRTQNFKNKLVWIQFPHQPNN